jgi:MFS family permease
MGSIAAPLLAGFSVTFAGLVLSSPTSFRWVNLTLALLLAAAFSLIATLQFTFRARQWAVLPSEIEQWWPDAKERADQLQTEQRTHRTNHRMWANLARHAYNLGILLFLGGLSSATFPPGAVSMSRVAVIAVAALGFVAEGAWFLSTLRRSSPASR